MNKEKVRLVIQRTLQTGLALVGVAIGGAIVAASRERLETNRVFNRLERSVKDIDRKKRNARRRELAAQKRQQKALVKDLTKAGFTKI